MDPRQAAPATTPADSCSAGSSKRMPRESSCLAQLGVRTGARELRVAQRGELGTLSLLGVLALLYKNRSPPG